MRPPGCFQQKALASVIMFELGFCRRERVSSLLAQRRRSYMILGAGHPKLSQKTISCFHVGTQPFCPQRETASLCLWPALFPLWPSARGGGFPKENVETTKFLAEIFSECRSGKLSSLRSGQFLGVVQEEVAWLCAGKFAPVLEFSKQPSQPRARRKRACKSIMGQRLSGSPQQPKHAQVARKTAAKQEVEGQRKAIEAVRECFVAMCRAFACANRDRGAQSL